jgi:hypothetical protein
MNETRHVIESAIRGCDELVFVYQKEVGDETKSFTRFVKPIEISEGTEASVLCKQMLPKSGFRRFKLSKITSAFRVMTRESFTNLEAPQ